MLRFFEDDDIVVVDAHLIERFMDKTSFGNEDAPRFQKNTDSVSQCPVLDEKQRHCGIMRKVFRRDNLVALVLFINDDGLSAFGAIELEFPGFGNTVIRQYKTGFTMSAVNIHLSPL
jgi:hypothetical protein